MEDFSIRSAFLEFDDKLQNSAIDFETLLNEIQNEYSADISVKYIKHLLEAHTDSKILTKVLYYISANQNDNYLPILVDFIMRQNSGSYFISLKVMAIKLLPKYNDKSCVQVLLFCLNDKNSNYKIKLASAEALGKIGDKNAFESLGKIATDENVESAYIKESAVTALGMLGDDRAIDVFSSIMNTKQIFKEKFSFLKEKIMEAMSKFDISRNKKAFDIIKTSLYDINSNVRISAIETLMNSDIEESYDLIFDVFKFDNDTEVRKNALVALYNIKNDISILEDTIRGDYPKEIKDYAIEIIKEIEEDEYE